MTELCNSCGLIIEDKIKQELAWPVENLNCRKCEENDTKN